MNKLVLQLHQLPTWFHVSEFPVVISNDNSGAKGKITLTRLKVNIRIDFTSFLLPAFRRQNDRKELPIVVPAPTQL